MNSLTLLLVTVALTGAAPAVVDPVAVDEAAIARHIKVLADPRSEVRAAAAAELRRIVAKYPSGTTNIRQKDGGESYWTEKVKQVPPGTPKQDVPRLLSPAADSPVTETEGPASGGTSIRFYQLDNLWSATVSFGDLLGGRTIGWPKLRRQVSRVWVAPPGDFTGTWVTWHINGQKSHEIEYRNGQYHGTFTSYHDNGRKSYEQHYREHIADGPDTGWFRDGELCYIALYRNGKQEGRWIHWYANGQKQAEHGYKNGRDHGRHANWHENGQILNEKNYRDGVQHGPEGGWDEKGELHYWRHYEDGKLVESPDE